MNPGLRRDSNWSLGVADGATPAELVAELSSEEHSFRAEVHLWQHVTRVVLGSDWGRTRVVLAVV